MSASVDNEVGENPPDIPVLSDVPVLPAVGARLLAAREKAGLSQAEAGAALKLGVRQIEALESGQWQKLPGPTFIRGFVRNYARLLGIDSASLMAQLDDQLTVRDPVLALPEGTHVAMPEKNPVRRNDKWIVVSALLLLLLAGGLYLFATVRWSDWAADFSALSTFFAGEEEKKPAAPAGPELLLPPGSTPEQVVAPQAVPAESAEREPVPAVTPQPAAAVPQQLADTVGVVPALRLDFSQPSWVEVRDLRGNVLLSQHGQPGMSRDVAGSGPFVLVIGYAPGVTLSHRGKPVDLTPYIRGEVARLTLE